MSCAGYSQLAMSDVVDVDYVMDVVVFQHYLFPGDRGALARCIDRVERGAEISVGRLVAEAQREPVEAHLGKAVADFEQLHVGDVVRGPRLGQTGRARTLGADPEDPILKALFGAVPNQRNLALRIFGQGI